MSCSKTGGGSLFHPSNPQRRDPARNTRPANQRIGSTQPLVGGDWDALWGEAFSPATPLKSAEVLAAHPNAAAFTARLVAEPTAARIVAANAMYNPCRPERLAASGRAASEEAWSILLSRQDTPYMRSGTRWERLVMALDPIPAWAATRLRNMDITALGSVAQALIRGPYRRV